MPRISSLAKRIFSVFLYFLGIAAITAITACGRESASLKRAPVAQRQQASTALSKAPGTVLGFVGTGTPGFSGDGGDPKLAQLNAPSGLTVGSDGAVYIADTGNNRVRRVKNGKIETFAGRGGTTANPNLSGSNLLRNPRFEDPIVSPGWIPHWQLFTAEGWRVVTRDDSCPDCPEPLDGHQYLGAVALPDAATMQDIRVGDYAATIDAGTQVFRLSVFVRSRPEPVPDNAFIHLQFITGDWRYIKKLQRGPFSSTSQWEKVEFVETAPVGTRVIRIAFQGVRKSGTTNDAFFDGAFFRALPTTSIGDGGPATNAVLAQPHQVATGPDGSVYIADTYHNRIRKVSSSGIITTVAGNGAFGFAGDGGNATSARLANPTGVAVDGAGTIYIADFGNHRIRRVTTDGKISTFAGDGTPGFSNSPPFRLSHPYSLSIGVTGEVVVADRSNHVIRALSPSHARVLDGVAGDPGRNDRTEIKKCAPIVGCRDWYITEIGRLWRPVSVVEVPAASELHAGGRFIGEESNRRLRHAKDDLIQTVAGDGTRTTAPDPDNIAAIDSKLSAPAAVAVGPDNSLYVADRESNRVRRYVCVDGNRCKGEPSYDSAQDKCTWVALSSDDDNPCTDDVCTWAHDKRNFYKAVGSSCADGNTCNGAETCNTSAVCTAGPPPTVTDDNNPCTVDYCDPTLGVRHEPLPSGSACASDGPCRSNGACIAGSCVTSPINVDDQNPCTADSCDQSVGVRHVPVADGIACGGGATCTGGACIAASSGTNAPSLGTTPPSQEALFSHIYSGTNPIQVDVTAGAINPERAALVTGKILRADLTPFQGATVTIVDHPEIGSTQTRTDGRFDLVVNGGSPLVVRISNAGYFTVDRNVRPDWHATVLVDDVILIPPDSTATTLQAGAAVIQDAAGSTITTGGTRQARVVLPPSTLAFAKLPNGSEQPLSDLTVRATEFTVGARSLEDKSAWRHEGLARMPAPLPPNTLYTYAAEFSIDEAQTLGASTVEFSQPVYIYVDNFMGFDVGTLIPSGYYDRGKAAWVPEPNGTIIKVLSVSGGLANVDLDGDGTAETAAQLAEIGMNNDERTLLANRYSAGKSLMRVPVTHFSPYDFNLPGRPPPCEPGPNQTMVCPGPNGGPPQKEAEAPKQGSCEAQGSIIGIEEQTLGESLPIAGTPFSLNYRSNNTLGYIANRSLSLPFAPDQHSKLLGYDVAVAIAGQTNRFGVAPNVDAIRYVWDGRDSEGRRVYGTQKAMIQIDAIYPATYQEGSNFGDFSLSGNEVLIRESDRQGGVQFRFRRHFQHDLTAWSAEGLGLGGWTIDAHHVYDPVGGILYRGNGTQEKVGNLGSGMVITRVAGNGSTSFAADGKDARNTGLWDTSGLAIAANGEVYFSHYWGGGKVRKIDSQGVIHTVAEFGDQRASGIAIGRDQSVYVASPQDHRVYRVVNGIKTPVAGIAGQRGLGVDGATATATHLNSPSRVAVAEDDTLYILDASGLIYKVGRDAKIRVFAGSTTLDRTSSCQDGASPHSLYFGGGGALAVATDGAVWTYLSSASTGARLVRIDASGQLKCISPGGFAAAGSPIGGVFFTDSYDVAWVNLIKKWEGEHAVTTFAGRNIAPGGAQAIPDGTPALGGWLPSINVMAVGPKGTVYFADNRYLYKVHELLPGQTAGCDIAVPGQGLEMYCFDQNGRHLSTRNSVTGTVIRSFEYTSDRLTRISDSDFNQTTIAYQPDKTVITGPFGQKTTIGINSTTKYATYVEDSSSARTEVSHDSSGLLRSMKDKNGKSYTFSYGELGRLRTDLDPAGGFQSFSRETIEDQPSANGYEVSRVTSLGRSSINTVTVDSDGVERRTVRFRGDLANVSALDRSGSLTTTFADRTNVSSKVVTDPVWGALAPYVAETTTTLPNTVPSQLVRKTTFTRSVERDTDNVTILKWKEDITVNSKTTKVTLDIPTSTYTITSPLQRKVTYAVDGLQRVRRIEMPDVPEIHPIEFTYDRGRISSIVQGTRLTHFQYAPLGSQNAGYLISATDAQGTVTIVPDSMGRADSVTVDDDVTGFTWDAMGNLRTLTPPGKPSHEQTYTAIGLLESYTPPAVPGVADPKTTYVYNKDRQLEYLVQPGQRSIDLVYSPSTGQLSRIQTPESTTTLQYYDSTPAAGYSPGNLKSITRGNQTVMYTYNGALQTGQTWSGAGDTINGAVSWTLNADFQPSAETVLVAGSSSKSTVRYDDDGRLVCASMSDCQTLTSTSDRLILTRKASNGQLTATSVGAVADAYTYNDYGELATYSANTLYSVTYDDKSTWARDPLGRVRKKTETILGTTYEHRYEYDVHGRLWKVYEGAGASPLRTYTYDSNGNRLSADGGVAIATYDEQDRLITYGSETFTYNENGNLRTRTGTTGTTSYTYDALGSLIRVALPNTDVIDYTTDGLGRRVAKFINGQLSRGWLYRDGLRPIAELDANGALLSRFVYASRSNVPDFMIRGGVLYRIISDQLGSPRLVVKASDRTVVQQIEHDEFGNVLVDTNPGFQPFGFAGGLYDSDTNLVRFGARDYDPTTGRWTAKDPIRWQGRQTNLFVYAHGDPVNFVDPTGLIGIFRWQAVSGGYPHSLPVHPEGEMVFLLGYSTEDGIFAGGLGAAGLHGGTDTNYAAFLGGKEVTACSKTGVHTEDIFLAEVGGGPDGLLFGVGGNLGVYRAGPPAGPGEWGIFFGPGAGAFGGHVSGGWGIILPKSWSATIDGWFR